MPELFVTGELLAAGGRAVLEVMLHEGTHALAVVRGIRDTRTWVLHGGARAAWLEARTPPMAWPAPLADLLAVLAPPDPGLRCGLPLRPARGACPRPPSPR